MKKRYRLIKNGLDEYVIQRKKAESEKDFFDKLFLIRYDWHFICRFDNKNRAIEYLQRFRKKANNIEAVQTVKEIYDI